MSSAIHSLSLRVLACWVGVLPVSIHAHNAWASFTEIPPGTEEQYTWAAPAHPINGGKPVFLDQTNYHVELESVEWCKELGNMCRFRFRVDTGGINKEVSFVQWLDQCVDVNLFPLHGNNALAVIKTKYRTVHVAILDLEHGGFKNQVQRA